MELMRRNVNYLGVEYRVVQVLDNELLLVVKESDYQNGGYPLQTYVIEDPAYYTR